MRILGVIPARYASTRFPGKPLADILGEPMIWRVYEKASTSEALTDLVVATDDHRIEEAVKIRGGKVLMTGVHHRNGTERCAEVLRKIGSDYDYLINIQGDEPFIHHEVINEIAVLLDGEAELATLAGKITGERDLANPDVVKVLFNLKNEAIYFSRHPIPYLRGIPKEDWLKNHTFYKHIALYAYRTDLLPELALLPPAPVETAESLEQLRWLENGYHIRIAISAYESMGIDTAEDLRYAIQKFSKS